MTYRDFEDLKKRAAVHIILRDKALNIAKNPKYDGYAQRLTLMVYNFFDKNTSGGVVKNEIMSNKKSAEELNKPIIQRFEKQKVHSSFIDNIWGTDLAHM